MAFYRVMTFITIPLVIYVGGVFVREQIDSNGVISDKYNGAVVVTNFVAVVVGFFHLGIAIPNIAIILQAKAAGAILFQVINRKF